MKMIIVIDKNLNEFEKKLRETHKMNNISDVDTDIQDGIFIAKFYIEG